MRRLKRYPRVSDVESQPTLSPAETNAVGTVTTRQRAEANVFRAVLPLAIRHHARGADCVLALSNDAGWGEQPYLGPCR